MPARDKKAVLVKGKIIKMNDAALKIASKHFGAKIQRHDDVDVPFELSKLPKLDIITALKEVKPTEKDIPEEIVKLPKLDIVTEVKEAPKAPEAPEATAQPAKTRKKKKIKTGGAGAWGGTLCNRRVFPRSA
mgnify:CR=1 FL=1